MQALGGYCRYLSPSHARCGLARSQPRRRGRLICDPQESVPQRVVRRCSPKNVERPAHSGHAWIVREDDSRAGVASVTPSPYTYGLGRVTRPTSRRKTARDARHRVRRRLDGVGAGCGYPPCAARAIELDLEPHHHGLDARGAADLPRARRQCIDAASSGQAEAQRARSAMPPVCG